jgi:NAD(P)-dependent dehydrogenase (short-subunit alcohol dehydrogenase family)
VARLSDKAAIVLGASRTGNMGQAIAKRFIDEGARVLVSGRGSAGLEDFANKHRCGWQVCDVRDKSQINGLADRALKDFGAVHVAVNAAATGQYSQFEQTTEAELDEMLSIIFKGSFYFMQVMVAAMREGGSIINVSSAVADIMFENHAAYMGAKAGMNHVTRAVANEYGAKGIRANIISPGLTVTPMLGNFMAPGMVDAFVKEYPLGRITTVDDIANAALFVASDECFMTGQTFHVTGGLTLRRNPTAAEIQAAIAAKSGSAS